jgi:hypothetical protein
MRKRRGRGFQRRRIRRHSFRKKLFTAEIAKNAGEVAKKIILFFVDDVIPNRVRDPASNEISADPRQILRPRGLRMTSGR